MGLAVTAWRRGQGGSANPYEREFYGMRPRAHRGYALAGLVFAALFAAGLIWSRVPVIAIWAVFTVVVVLYGASFVRGASGEDE